MSICVFWVELNHFIEVFDCTFMETNHLVRFCPFVDESYVSADPVDTIGKRKDRLLKLLNAAVGQSHVVVDVTLVS